MTEPGPDGDREAIESAIRAIVAPDTAVAAAIKGRPPIIADAGYPEETATVATAVESRKSEFAAGRWCARRALAELGVASGPIPVGPNRQPMWPDGHAGSISHTSQLVVAVACSIQHCRSIGIDVELDQAVTESLVPQVLTPPEAQRHRQRPELDLATKCFSAKEALYKSVYPLTEQWLGFEHVDVEFDLEAQRFRAKIDARAEHDFAGRVVAGRITHIFGHVITSSSVL